ncbi:hypothetical protein H6F50_21290 [Coleofasciculus sp. FACHB-712]|uniref:ParM/StbA family protein n=1 Tax=Coleofasciculus sp. FACHB-712 TaxID=2692789 RepID=UPI0016845D7A|nr:hypothetical protein [Coleofasciculus sp. FACHB-712]MBD1944861.1 hypothetical protein [Coleofasciculus sp. FACHB-712]
MTMTQPSQAGFARNILALPTGADVGAGLTKICIGSGASQMKVRMPSKIVQVREELHDILTAKDGGYFFYHSGEREDLVGLQFLVGSLAAWKSPSAHTKLSDDPVLKGEFCLHLLLGSLASLSFRPEWNLHLVLSTHNKSLFQEVVTAKTQGSHVINFGGKNAVQSRVNLKVSLVVPEGAGSYAYCVSGTLEPLIDKTASAIGIDIGTATTIVNIFAPGGAIVHRKVLEIGGCIDLLDLIASDPELIQFLGSGKVGSIEMIRQGIESREFKYGTRNFDFRPIYLRHLKPWLADRLRLAFKEVSEWRDSAQSLVCWGGGAELPGVAKLLASQGITAVPDGCWANAIGLQRLAQARFERGK